MGLSSFSPFEQIFHLQQNLHSFSMIATMCETESTVLFSQVVYLRVKYIV